MGFLQNEANLGSLVRLPEYFDGLSFNYGIARQRAKM
jgi:hypothetical protein